jgi:hypothetical protein
MGVLPFVVCGAALTCDRGVGYGTGMGRPPLSPDAPTGRTTVRAPVDELADAKAKARARGLPLAEWTRELWRDALGAEEYLAAVALPDEDGEAQP